MGFVLLGPREWRQGCCWKSHSAWGAPTPDTRPRRIIRSVSWVEPEEPGVAAEAKGEAAGHAHVQERKRSAWTVAATTVTERRNLALQTLLHSGRVTTMKIWAYHCPGGNVPKPRGWDLTPTPLPTDLLCTRSPLHLPPVGSAGSMAHPKRNAHLFTIYTHIYVLIYKLHIYALQN